MLNTRCNDTQLVDGCCEYLIRIARALKSELADHFTVIQSQLLQTFQTNPKNFKCLQTVSVLIKLLGSAENPQMRQEICGSVDSLCLMVLEKTMK